MNKKKIDFKKTFCNIFSSGKKIVFWGILFTNTLNTSLAANIGIEASIPSGKYDQILKIELKTTDPKAKIFYSFNPNGTPNDFLVYTGSIIIKKSTPLIYWGFIDTKNETKIMQNDYEIYYSNDIRLGTGVISENGVIKNAIITNIGTGKVDISFWEIKKNDLKITIPENTILEPNNNYELSFLTGTGIINLFSPDEEKKDFVQIQEVKQDIKPADTSSIINTKPYHESYINTDYNNHNYYNNKQEKLEGNNTEVKIETTNSESKIQPNKPQDNLIGNKEDTQVQNENPLNQGENTSNNNEVIDTPTTEDNKNTTNGNSIIENNNKQSENNIANDLKIDIKNTNNDSDSKIYIVFGMITVIILVGLGRIIFIKNKNK